MPRMETGRCFECDATDVLLFPTAFKNRRSCLNCLPEIKEAAERAERMESSRSVKVRKLEPGEVLPEARASVISRSAPDSLHYIRFRLGQTREPA
jgi:hypothetical protein